MNALEAASSLLNLISTASNLLASAQQVGALIQKAQQEGRTTFTAEEWAVVQGADATSRQALVAAISAALLK